MTKACDYKYTINYKSAKHAYHVTGPDGVNAYLVDKPDECYLVYPKKKINLTPGMAIYSPFGGDVFLNTTLGASVEDYEMDELLVDNLKTTASASFI